MLWTIFFISLFSGILTVLAPCVLPLLPVILGGSLLQKKRTVWIIVSLIASLMVFTLLLKATTVLIHIPEATWRYISGGLLILFACTLLFPQTWEKIVNRFGWWRRSHQLLEQGSQKQGILGAILIGSALGPVFSSCSPAYALLLATVLPLDFGLALWGLFGYFLGLGIVLFSIAQFGHLAVSRVRFLANPSGYFRKILATILLLVGFLVFTGYIKHVETFLVKHGWYINTLDLEERLTSKIQISESSMEQSSGTSTENACHKGTCEGAHRNELLLDLGKAPELVGIVDWINTEPLTMQELKGKVVLVDFWTYSCINCIRTQPYLNRWHDTYGEQGLVILWVHAPEFAFEKLTPNVREAVTKAKILYPVALDNTFATWKAYGNRYWPAKYLIDTQGNIIYKHFGEGKYEETEQAIRTALGLDLTSLKSSTESSRVLPKTPETYLGSARADHMIGSLRSDRQLYEPDWKLAMHQWTLQWPWKSMPEYIEALEPTGPKYVECYEGMTAEDCTYKVSMDWWLLAIRFSAKKVFLVVSSETKQGQLRVSYRTEGASESSMSPEKVIEVTKDDIYTVFESSVFEPDSTLYIQASPGLRLHAFTFDN